jgi:hypothetical protein
LTQGNPGCHVARDAHPQLELAARASRSTHTRVIGKPMVREFVRGYGPRASSVKNFAPAADALAP